MRRFCANTPGRSRSTCGRLLCPGASGSRRPISVICRPRARQCWSPLVLSLAGLFSPLAVVVAFIWNRPKLRADIADRLKWPAADRLPWVLAAVFLVPVSLLAAQGVSLFFGYGLDQFSLRGVFTFSAGLTPAWATLIGAAIIEELAWHSYGTDTLVRKMRVFSASMLFTLIWALWHVPLSFIDGYYQNEVVES